MIIFRSDLSETMNHLYEDELLFKRKKSIGCFDGFYR